MDATLPSFYIEKQESLAFDKFSRNGQSVDLHLVAKNIAFVVHLAASFDLGKFPPVAKLIYESIEEEKDVEAVKSTPIEITSHVDETGLKAAVEVKVGVLSSQHEGAFFRIKFENRDPVTGLPLTDYSQPIKVISKRNQVKKIMERKQQALESSKSTPKTPKAPMTPPPPSSNKRPAPGNGIEETLHRLEQQQQLQFDILQLLLAQNMKQQPLALPNPDDMDFETAFSNFLKAYKRIPDEDRPKKIRRLAQSTDCGQGEFVAEFVSCFAHQASYCHSDLSACSEKSCKCQECPYKKELAQLSDLYDDFITDPLSPEKL